MLNANNQLAFKRLQIHTGKAGAKKVISDEGRFITWGFFL